MLKILEDISLRPYNTFGIDVKTRWFVESGTYDEILDFLAYLEEDRKPLLVLGGGSNILFTRDFPGTILHLTERGINLIEEDEKSILIRARSAENWDDLVSFTVHQGWGGLENLSLIPGYVGAAPVQNIGAYGVELQDCFHELEAIHLETQITQKFNREQCRFGYRESIFKGTLKGQYLILHVTFRLSKQPQLKLDYGSIREELRAIHVENPSIGDVREAVVRIRRRKLPDPMVIGNAGSFFTNPEVSAEKLSELQDRFPGIIFFPSGDRFKLASAWLIEQCGWKGKRLGGAGVHADQPLVLVNFGTASGKDILDLANQIAVSVHKRFGVSLESEVNII